MHELILKMSHQIILQLVGINSLNQYPTFNTPSLLYFLYFTNTN